MRITKYRLALSLSMIVLAAALKVATNGNIGDTILVTCLPTITAFVVFPTNRKD
jgi:hypothetical protein